MKGFGSISKCLFKVQGCPLFELSCSPRGSLSLKPVAIKIFKRRRKRMKNFMGGRQETGSEVSQKKHRRTRKPKFEIGKPKRVYDKKKKDKKRNRLVTTQIARLRLEEFAVMFSELREGNRRLKELISEINVCILDKLAVMFSELREANRQQKELISEINAYILDKLATWDAGDN